MKRVKTVKQVGVRQSLLLAGLILVSAGAQAAVLPKITVTGVIGSSVTAEGATLQYDPSAWFGKAYTLEMIVNAEGVTGSSLVEPGFPGLVLNKWTPVQVSHSLIIDGVLVSASAVTHASLETFNDFTIPSVTPGVPPGFVDGQTYDSIIISADGEQLGCETGACVNFWMTPQYAWNNSQVNAIADSDLPNILSGAPFFTGGFGFMRINFEAPNIGNAGYIDSSVTSMTVTAVPEPETYAMLLAGLGLVGFAARRRAA